MKRKGKASSTAKKIDIDKLSLEKLKELRETLEKAKDNCSGTPCEKCVNDRHNFTGRASIMGCPVIRGEVNRLIEALEEKEEKATLPPEAKLPKPPYDIDKLSFPQLLTLAKKANEVKRDKKCPSGGCLNCICDNHNYTGELSSYGCDTVHNKIVALLISRLNENRSKIEKATSGKKSSKKQEELELPKCACSDCKWLDSEMLHKGYHFCLHWHNFTVEDGNCHAYESNEKAVEACG